MRQQFIGIGRAALVVAFSGTVPFASAADRGADSMSTYQEVVANLTRASVPIRELQGTGRAAVTLAAGRVVALAFAADGPNLLWSNPELGNTELVKQHPEKLVGGFGGDRLWFAPELDYHWNGAPQWQTFENYQTPSATDPGAYKFVDSGQDTVRLHVQAELPARSTVRRVGLEVERLVRMTPSPLKNDDPAMSGVDYVGIETSHSLQLAQATKTGRVDLWHLLQAPVGSVLIVPLRRDASPDLKKPLSYGLPGGWIEKADHVMWRYGGKANAKFGLPAAALTGRTAVLRPLDAGRWCLIVREFPVDAKAKYGDHPYGAVRDDQVFQAWDGYGFGEMEYHSPMLDAEQGSRKLTDADRLWAFGGSASAIAALAERLLSVDVRYVVGS